MKSFTANWKTSVTGALTVLVGIASLCGLQIGSVPPEPSAAIAMISGGLGLIFAKDGNVTGGTVSQ